MDSGWFVASYVVLWVLLAFSFILWLVLLRQIGVLHARWGPRSAIQIEEGPELGAVVPRMSFPSLAGGEVEVPGRDGMMLAVLMSPNCGTCHELAPGVAAIMRDPPEGIRTVALVSGPDEPEVSAFVDKHGFARRDAAYAPAANAALNVETIPAAFVFDADGRTLNKGVPNTLEQLEVLVAQVRDRDDDSDTLLEGAHAHAQRLEVHQ
jgi:methylamine dehydrogenase accessory protein MauD